jgi:adenylate cyclase
MDRKEFLRRAVIGATISILAYLAYALGVLDPLELKSVDFRFQLRGPVRPRSPILLVSIDQDSFDELNLPWPWPRTLHADLIQKLSEGKAKTIGLDILFTESKPDSIEDQVLAQAIKAAGNVILAAERTEVETPFGRKSRINLPVPLLRAAAHAYGLANLYTDHDGVIRRNTLRFNFQGTDYPSFPLAIFRALQRGENAPPVSADTMMINFRGPGRTYPIVPYYRILRGEVDPSLYRGKIVLIGAFAPSLHDVFATSFSAFAPMAGIEIQANVLEMLLLNETIIPLPDWAHILLFVVLSCVAIRLSLGQKPYWAAVSLALLVAGFGLFDFYLFSKYRILVPLTPLLFGMVASYGGITVDGYVREYKERLRLRRTFNQYVSPEVVDEILADRRTLGLKGQRRHITVLFSDIRGFTSISEQNDPETVVAFLSDYLEQATRIVFDNGGTVDKFIGDAVMALFGAPKSFEDDARRAVKAGIDMISLASTLEAKWKPVIGSSLKFGVGINSGDAVVGSIGSERHSDYTAIGDTVNIAARLEALTKELAVPLLMSETTMAELKSSIPVEPLGAVRIIGRVAPLEVFTVKGFGADTTTRDTGVYVQKQK